MASQILAGVTASISKLRKNPMATVAAGEGEGEGEGGPVAILNRHKPVFYCVPAKAWEQLMDKLEDVEMAIIAKERKDEAVIEVPLDDL